MKIYLKIIILFAAMFVQNDAKSQQFYCTTAEKVMYDWKLNVFIVSATSFYYDTILIDKKRIQIKSKKTDLTKLRELSQWQSYTGKTTIYESIANKSNIVTVWLVEPTHGLNKIVIMDSPNSNYGTAYNLIKQPVSKDK